MTFTRPTPASMIKALLLCILLWFIGGEIVQQTSTIQWSNIHPSPVFLIFVLCFELLGRFFVGVLCSILLEYSGSPVPLSLAVSVVWISLLGKYIPGKVAVVGSAVYILKDYGVKVTDSTIALVIVNLLTIAAALILSLPLFFSSIANQMAISSWLFFPFLIFMIVISFFPQVIIVPVNFIVKRMGHPALEISFSFRQILLFFVIVIIQCCCIGISAWCTIRAFIPIEISALPFVISVSSFAGVIGFLVLFSPAGLGVREGIYLLALSSLTGPEAAALAAVILRVMQTVADMLAGVLGAFILKLKKFSKIVPKILDDEKKDPDFSN